MHSKRPAALLAVLACCSVISAWAHSDGDDTAASRTLDCDHLPPAALTRLPAPLDGWARIDCLPAGQLLAAHKDWIWRYPASFTTPVFLPAWTADPMQAAVGGRYFASAELIVARAEQAADAHRRFAAQLEVYGAMTEGRPPPSEVYTLTATNDLGQVLHVHFLYRSRQDVWAIVCAPDCRSEYSFLVSARGN
jgi:hypothetical protein